MEKNLTSKLGSFQKVREILNAAAEAHPDRQSRKGIADLRERIKNAEHRDGE